MLTVSLIGCESAEQKASKMYSGTFSCISRFPQKIVIKKWEGFGFASPSTGNLIPNAISVGEFGPLKAFPDVVVVSWVVEGETEVKTQEIKLKGIVPVGTEGRTHFELSKEGEWNISFRTKKWSVHEK